MHFRTFDERPFAVPQHGAPRLLLGFAALSLLLHGLLLINGDGAAPLTIQQLGSPYIRAVLSNQPAASANNNPTPKTDKPAEEPPVAAIHKARHDTPEPDTTKTASKQGEIIRVRETPAPSPVVAEIREPLNTTDSHSETPPLSVNDEQTDTTRQTSPATTSHAQKITASTTQMNAAAQRNYLLGQLQDQLSRYLSYPLRARRRGWEGEVLLGLRLDGDGQLHDIHLLRSSGYALLDRSAQKALARIERLRLPANAPPLQPANLQLPVVYRLSEG